MTTDVIQRARPAEGKELDKLPPNLPSQLLAVWAQLMRRRRKDGRFLYPTLFDLGYGTAQERQEFAIWMLLDCACEFAKSPGPPCGEAETMRADLHGVARTLRKTVKKAVHLGIRKPHILGTEPNIDPLIVAAEEAEDLAIQLDRMTIPVQRDRGVTRERAVAIRIAGMCHLLFGRPMPAIVASLLAALLDCKVERHRIRDWWDQFTTEE
jgi:hypothetical protein